MLGLGFEVARPPGWYFDFPPRQDPIAVPPPQDVFDWRSPFNVDPTLYRALLEPKVPLTIATVYFFTVKIMNQINRRRGFKPYAFSKTTAWWLFCVLHNIFLAVYSGVTFAAMVRTMYISLPGFLGPRGIPGQLDALCKMHGPRGWGDAIQYNPNSTAWQATNHFIRLGPDGLSPDDTDVGRIWNEGLAFWGWLFYLSKFYEVVDTAIILASGKRSATLQTYHHTGAMLCMWAGIRYMSPPIWLFCYLNSFIHTVMYTYYTLHLFKVQVPKRFKRVLTTAQILQFLIGVYFATAHLFVTYKIPISVPAGVKAAMSNAPEAASAAASAVSSAGGKLLNTASLSSLAAAAATSADWAWLKKLALRAANFEGAAENVWTGTAEKYASLPGSVPQAAKEIKYHTEYQTVRCIDTQAQAFAIWLNVIYLAPLTFLFGRFFFKAYLRGQQPQPVKDKKAPRKVNGQASSGAIQSAVDEAAEKTREEVEKRGAALERSLNSTVEEIKQAGEDLGLEERLAKLEKELNASHSEIKYEGDVVEEQQYTTSRSVKTSSSSFSSKKVDTSVESYADAVKEGTNGEAQ